MRNAAGILFAIVLGLCASGCSGCGGGSSYCDAVCDCERCGDRDYNNCLDDYDYQTDRADRYGCGADWDDYAACVEEYYGCRDSHFGCGREWDRYQSCVK